MNYFALEKIRIDLRMFARYINNPDTSKSEAEFYKKQLLELRLFLDKLVEDMMFAENTNDKNTN